MFVPTPPPLPENGPNTNDLGESMTIDPDLEQELRAYVGRNAGYYLPRWKQKLVDANANSGNNWAAFLLTGLWLPYRKMYKLAFILYGIVLVYLVLEYWFFVNVKGMDEPPRGSSSLFGLIVGIVVGLNGNNWYLNQARREIERVRSKGLEKEARLNELAKRGGTNLYSVLGFLVLFVSATLASLFALELLFFPQ